MEDPELVATLISSDEHGLAINAFCHKHNKDRYIAPCDLESSSALSTRKATPATEPKNPAKGFCFGANPNICDIVLGKRRQGISNAHFYITFDTFDAFEGRTRLILKDVSTRGTAVAYSGQAGNEVRNHFVWILDLEKEEGSWEVKVHVEKLRFIVELATHKTCDKESEEKVKKFLVGEPMLDGLAIYTPTEPASPTLHPRAPIYIGERELGRGSFGSVEKVTDVSTGKTYARKNFFEPQWEKIETHRAQQREKWMERVHREIRIMKESKHENIAEVVDDRKESPPFLVMPYFPLGNLHDQHSERTLSELEVIDVLHQALDALQYLHARSVAHRDLKPENILVASRTPLQVKLADFGLANDKPNLETACGTQVYSAPEIYRRSRYTTAVDLWSLGVIVLDYVYGLPSKNLRISQSRHEEWGLAWCSRIVHHANDIDSDALVDLLTAGMLKMRPDERFSADACLVSGYNSGLFGGHTTGGHATGDHTAGDHTAGDHNVDSGSATPRLRLTAENGMSDSAGSTSIVLDALWDMEDEISDQSEENGVGGSLGRLPECTGGFKRLRSPAAGPTIESSGRQVKRRPRKDHPYLEKTIDTLSGHTSASRIGEFGVTYPSALLDCTHVSGCSIPTKSRQSGRVK